MVQGKSTLIENLESGKQQTVVAYGTSLTENGSWVETLKLALEDKFPQQVKLFNSGGSGKNSNWGLEQLDARVLRLNPDTVFLEFSINDAVARFQISVEHARQNLEDMIRQIHERNPECEIILMTMTPGSRYPIGHRSHRANIEAHYEMYRSVAKAHGLLLIDHFPKWKALETKDPERFKEYAPDTIHPNAKGNAAIVSPTILQALGLPTRTH